MRYLPGTMTSVSTLSPNFQTLPSITLMPRTAISSRGSAISPGNGCRRNRIGRAQIDLGVRAPHPAPGVATGRRDAHFPRSQDTGADAGACSTPGGKDVGPSLHEGRHRPIVHGLLPSPARDAGATWSSTPGATVRPRAPRPPWRDRLYLAPVQAPMYALADGAGSLISPAVTPHRRGGAVWRRPAPGGRRRTPRRRS